MNKEIAEKIGASVLLIVCITALILNSALHLHFTKGGDAALIIGAILGAVNLI
jgi:hypothetical protein